MCLQTNLGLWRNRPDELYGAISCSFFLFYFLLQLFRGNSVLLCEPRSFTWLWTRMEGGDYDLIFISGSGWILWNWGASIQQELCNMWSFHLGGNTSRTAGFWRAVISWYGSVQNREVCKVCQVIMSKRIKLGVGQTADLSPFMKLWHDYWSFNTPCCFLRHLSFFLFFFSKVWELSGLCSVSVF